MKEQIVYTAYCVADKIDLSAYQKDHAENLLSRSAIELYYQFAENQHAYLFSYGVIVFVGLDQKTIESHLEQLKNYLKGARNHHTNDSLQVNFDDSASNLIISFSSISISRLDHAVNKMIMMHLAQSVALDHYNAIIQSILGEIKTYTHYLQLHGKLKLGQKKALQFIGRTLNTKNNIAENLYILDGPEVTWEDEYLARLHDTLAKHLELVPRYREIENTLKIIEDNLDVYLSYNHHRESSRLEWIIIILIVIEVLDTFATKLL